MNCFAAGKGSTLPAGEDQAPSVVTRNPSYERKKDRRKSSLNILIESFKLPYTKPLYPHSPPDSSATPKRFSWSQTARPIISSPRPLSSPLNSFRAPLAPAAAPFRTVSSISPIGILVPKLKNMESVRGSRLLHPGTATSGRLKQVREAQDMEKAVHSHAKRLGISPPPFDLLELIGKGSFGRVFKSRKQKENTVVAVKIVDVDSSDYKLAPAEKDQAIKDFVNEISVLQTLRESKAKNINIIYEAFNFHSQLWIVSEYCPGGSVHTLMKASTQPGLEEKYIVAISRELAVALKYVHEAGIIHRDVKAANVLITQEGLLQLCDFGVSGVLESNVAKRSTIIGTPFWMAPEMHEEDAMPNGYGTEVDCWAFGCTVYEMATGQPPNARIAPQRLHMFLKKAPRLEGGDYSAQLREFVSFCLEERPEDRPSADGILKHAFVANTSKRYPTTILRQLIDRFASWENSGGQRASLFNPYGASAPTMHEPFADDDDEWNFSVNDDFAEELLSQFAPRTPETQAYDELDKTPKQAPVKAMTFFEKAQHEHRAERGGMKMARLFDESAAPYEYSVDEEDSEHLSDLPLRRVSPNHLENRETIIDLDDARLSQDLSSATSLDLAGMETIRANRNRLRFLDEDDDDDEEENDYGQYHSKRKTRDWKFPTSQVSLTASEIGRPRTQDWSMAKATAEANQPAEEAPDLSKRPHLDPPFRPTLKHTVTEPLGNVGDFVHRPGPRELSSEPPDRSSLIDLDIDFEDSSRRPSTASSTGESSLTNGDPFYLEEQVENQNTIRVRQQHQQQEQNRTSFHMHSQSEPSAGDRTSTGYLNHTRGTSSLSSEFQLDRQRQDRSSQHGRSMSVKASVDSLRQAAAAEDYWDRDFVPAFRKEASLEESAQPLLTGSKKSGLSKVNQHWAYSDASMSSAQSTDVEGTDIRNPRADGSQFTYNQSYGPAKWPEINSRPTSRGRTMHNTNGRGPTSVDHGFDNDPSTARSRAYPNQRGSQEHQRPTRTVIFPQPIPPRPHTLDDEGDQEALIAEVDRLLGDYMAGLRVAGDLLKGQQEQPSAHSQLSKFSFKAAAAPPPVASENHPLSRSMSME